MPDIYFPISIYLDDYFAKYGFDDGSEEWIGWQFREEALDILNKHLQDTDINAEESDVGSCHNNCRIVFIYNGKDLDDIDHTNWKNKKVWAKILKDKNMGDKVVRAIEAADKEFDDEILDDISRLIKTPDQDLPLLINRLKSEDGKKFYKRLLKGATNESDEQNNR